MKRKRRRNVLQQIRRQRRDPFRVHIKSIARFSRDPLQLELPIFPGASRPRKPVVPSPWPDQQIDLEDWLKGKD
jgi:hypothetical protein